MLPAMRASGSRRRRADREGSFRARECSVFDTIALLGALGVALAAALYGLRRRRAGEAIVYQWEKGLLLRDGAIVRVLEPGRHATWPARVAIERIDMRELASAAPMQEVLTKDNLTLKATIAVLHAVADPIKHRTATDAPHARLYEAMQAALRERIGARTLDEILANRAALADGLAAELDAAVAWCGLKVTRAYIRDLALAGPAKQALADLWKAQKDGLAALERARGEQAALRALANAARQLKGNPELMNLRILSALAGQSGKPGASLILGGGPGLTPIVRESEGGASAPDGASDE
jgi:regulator of protease activity HflC (stomatin/prohibitin superfamily)